MKKLILGLFLIASSSSYVFANTVEIKSNLDQQEAFAQIIAQHKDSKGENSDTTTKDYYTQFFKGCYKQTVTQVENAQGEYQYSIVGPRTAAPCAEGAIEGSTATTYVHTTNPYSILWP